MRPEYGAYVRPRVAGEVFQPRYFLVDGLTSCLQHRHLCPDTRTPAAITVGPARTAPFSKCTRNVLKEAMKYSKLNSSLLLGN